MLNRGPSNAGLWFYIGAFIPLGPQSEFWYYLFCKNHEIFSYQYFTEFTKSTDMLRDIYILVKKLDKIQNLPKGAHTCCFASPEDSNSMRTLVLEVRPSPFLTGDVWRQSLVGHEGVHTSRTSLNFSILGNNLWNSQLLIFERSLLNVLK